MQVLRAVRRSGRVRTGRAPFGAGSAVAVLLAVVTAGSAVAVPLAVATAGSAVPAGRDPCLPASAGERTVVGVTDGGAVRIDDGRIVRLAGIAIATAPLGVAGRRGEAGRGIDPAAPEETAEAALPPVEPDVPRDMDDRKASGEPVGASAALGLEAEAVAALERLVAGRRVSIRPIGSGTDRHGRVAAHLAREPDGLWLSAALVAEGLARVVPRAGDAGCARTLQAVEADARRAARGLWAVADFAPRKADDPDLAAAAGRYALVEGRVLSTGHAGTRHYLNFGGSFRSDFTAVIEDKDVGRFKAAGLEPARLKGRSVRLRGWLTVRDGGLMVLSLPEEIEWVQ